MYLLSAILLLATSFLFLSRSSYQPLQNLRVKFNLIRWAVLFSLVGGVGAIVFSQMEQASEIDLLIYKGLGLSIRIDQLSTLMYFMIAIIALVVLRFSRNYLEGDPKQAEFLGKLGLTIAFVQLFVLSGNLLTLFVAWTGTSIGLRQLLLFYPERKKAVVAEGKKFIIARMGDVLLLSAFALIYIHFGTGSLTEIFTELQLMTSSGLSWELELASILLVFSAFLKSVQVPFHGWLLDVMETPTPVSALLHAGLLNAGPFLIIRFAYLIDLSTFAPILLLSVGALSALFGALASTFQPTIKTSLAYSSIGHMGFSLMVSGLGVYSASLLHLVAHSFYKANSFLSSGSVIDKVQVNNKSAFQRTGNSVKMLLSLLFSLLIFAGCAYFWGINEQTEFQLLLISAFIFLGVLALQTHTLDSKNKWNSILILSLGALLVTNAFYFMEHSVDLILGNQIPEMREADLLMKWVSGIVLFLFLGSISIQLFYKTVKNSSSFKVLEVHFRNGLYINHFFDRWLNAYETKTFQKTTKS